MNRIHRVVVAAVSGGPDSVYLLRKLSSEKGTRIVVGHVNYGTRGDDSLKDQKLVERIGRKYRYKTVDYEIQAGSAGIRPGGSLAGSRRRLGISGTGF